MSKFCNIIFSTFNDIFYPIVHKSFSSPCTSSPRAKLNFSKSDFQNARILKVFSLDVKIRYHGFHIYNLPQKRYRIFFSERKIEHGNIAREDSYRPTFSTNTFDAATRRNVLASGLTIIVYFTSSTGHSSVSVASYIPRGQFFHPSPPEESLRAVRSMEHRFTAYKGRQFRCAFGIVRWRKRERWWFHVLVNDWMGVFEVRLFCTSKIG